jgi:ABC-type transport system involved in multi-copper enzyme maturation permease subunit
MAARIRGLPILRVTLLEVVNRRLVAWGAGLSVLFLLLYAVGYWFLYHNEAAAMGAEAFVQSMAATVLVVFGMYVVSFLGAFLALLVSVGSVSAEIDGGTLQAVLARPLRRSSWLLQRWLGLVLLMGAYVAVMSTGLLLIARVIAGFRPGSMLLTVALMVAQSTALVTLGLMLSSRLSTMAAGVVAFTLFGLAWLGGLIEVVGEIVSNTAMVSTGVAVSLLMPSDVLWRGASYFVQAPSVIRQVAGMADAQVPFAAASPPTALSLWWAAGWVVVVLGFALRRFSRRDL